MDTERKRIKSFLKEGDDQLDAKVIEQHNQIVEEYNEGVTKYNNRRFRRGVLLGMVGALTFWILSGFLADVMDRVEESERPMPCTENQVYVWNPGDFPNSAHCVWEDDHAGHTGGSEDHEGHGTPAEG